MKKFIVAGIFLLISAVISLGGAALGIWALIADKGVFELLKEYFVADFVDYFVKFIVPFFEQSAALVLISGAVLGILSIFAAVALFRMKTYGIVLGILISVISLVLMPFMLPVGLATGTLGAVVLTLVLMGVYGKSSTLTGKSSAEKIELL